jgi:hypothetical protein
MRRIVVFLGTLVVSVGAWSGIGLARPSHAAAAGSCNILLQVFPGLTGITVNGDNSCTGLVQMSGSVLLQNFAGTDCGGSFPTTVTTSDDAACTYSPAPPANYTATYRTTLTTIDGSLWAGSSPSCIGYGTPTLSCVLTLQFVYVPGQALPPPPVGATVMVA